VKAEPDAAVIAAQPGVSSLDLPESSGAECQDLREKRLSEITAGWTLCSEDSQCVVAPGVCGWPKAIHNTYLHRQEVLNQCLGPIINCAAPWNQPSATEARCEAGHCRIGAAAR